MAIAGKQIKRGVAVLVALVLVYAWIDGGSEDLEEIVVPVRVSGDAT